MPDLLTTFFYGVSVLRVSGFGKNDCMRAVGDVRIVWHRPDQSLHEGDY